LSHNPQKKRHENHHESHLVGGIPTLLKNDGVKVSGDDFPFPTEWKVIKFHGSSQQQPDTYTLYITMENQRF
jgi:hypothetical protein